MSERPKLGLSFDTELHEGGAKVTSVASGTPNEKLGIKEGDAITKFDGANINNYWALMRELSDREIGDKVKIEVKRGEEVIPYEIELLTRDSKSKQVPLADRPKDKKKNKDAEPILPDEPKGPRPYFGATLDGEADVFDGLNFGGSHAVGASEGFGADDGGIFCTHRILRLRKASAQGAFVIRRILRLRWN